MTLCAAHALKERGQSVVIVTLPMYRELVEACPHVDEVVTEARFVENEVDLCSAAHGTADMHQVDSYLKACGVTEPDPRTKSLDLIIPDSSQLKILSMLAPKKKKRILIHPSFGDSNRTWSRENWVTLISSLISDGHQVIQIGSNQGDKGVLSDLSVSYNFTNQLSFLDLVALYRSSDILISNDSGPIQLAGASKITIIGLYSVVKGVNRLPFRTEGTSIAIEAPCPHFPCYSKMRDPNRWNQAVELLRDGTATLNDIFANWCPKGNFSCGISVHDVLKHIEPGVSNG